MAKRKISKPLSITTEAIAEALKTTDGGVYLAAERLRCNPGTIYDRIKADPTLAELKNNLRGKLVDIAETSLKRGVLSGEGWAVCFTLKTIGKDRGYVERSEITGKDGGPVQTSGVLVVPGMASEEEWQRLQEARKNAGVGSPENQEGP